MALMTCGIQQFVTDAVCYGMHKLSPQEQKALLIYAMTLELQAISGIDYTTSKTTTLMSDVAKNNLFYLTPDQRMAAFVNLAFVQAELAGAAVPSSLGDKLNMVKCLKTVPMERLDALVLYLTCLLGPDAPQ